MNIGLLFLILLLNLAISFFNASMVGRYWTERKGLPGGFRLMLWSGAIMAICGFFSVFVTVITMVMYDTGAFIWIAANVFKFELLQSEVEMLVRSIFNLSYLAIIFPVLGSGLTITVNSWLVAMKRRDVTSGAIGLYNTGAQIHNMVSAARHVPRATKELKIDLGDLLDDDDAVKAFGLLMILLFPIVISLGLAIAVTAVVMRASDAKYDLNDAAEATL